MLVDVPADDWDRVMGVNAKGVWLTMRALVIRVASSEWAPSVRVNGVAEAILAVHDMRWVVGQIVPADGGLSLRRPISPLGPHPD